MPLAIALALALLGENAGWTLDRADYLFRDAGLRRRPVAALAVRLTVWPTHGVVSLTIDVRAADPRVRPAPGLAGVTGQNRYTARQLALLAREGSHEVVTAASGSGDARVLRRGRFRVTERAPLVRRRFAPFREAHDDARTVVAVRHRYVVPLRELPGQVRTAVRFAGQERLVVEWTPRRITTVRQPGLESTR